MSKKTHSFWVQIEAECRYHPFLSVKEGLNVLDAKNINFHFFAFLKSFSVYVRSIAFVCLLD